MFCLYVSVCVWNYFKWRLTMWLLCVIINNKHVIEDCRLNNFDVFALYYLFKCELLYTVEQRNSSNANDSVWNNIRFVVRVWVWVWVWWVWVCVYVCGWLNGEFATQPVSPVCLLLCAREIFCLVFYCYLNYLLLLLRHCFRIITIISIELGEGNQWTCCVFVHNHRCCICTTLHWWSTHTHIHTESARLSHSFTSTKTSTAISCSL